MLLELSLEKLSRLSRKALILVLGTPLGAVGTAVARTSAGALLLFGLASAQALGAEPLPPLNVDLRETSVSGLSSGAYMAGQFHVAHSGTLIGAGIVAGGPYYCARGSLATALNTCMETHFGEPDPAALLDLARGLASAGRIDDLRNLKQGRVIIVSGSNDRTVSPALGAAAGDFYALAGIPTDAIRILDDLPAGHAMITDDFGNPCQVTESPYVNDCDVDLAGAILGHIYGTLKPPAIRLSGALREFDQSEFIEDSTAHSMNEVGYVYVPVSCASGVRCRLHVAFHGCRQTTRDVGDVFYTRAGYNEWADTNGIVMLYPQAWSGPGNPRGCWDWWGYDDVNYHTRRGRQTVAVFAMLQRLASGQTCIPNCDTTPPRPPAGLQIREKSARVISLHWEPGAEDDLAGYNVLQANSPSGPYQQVNANLVIATTFRADKLTPDTEYFFVVDAVDASGNRSAHSGTVRARTTAADFCKVHVGTAFGHLVGGRATWCGWWSACARGSGDRIGFAGSLLSATVFEQPIGFFSKEPCAK